MPATSFTRRDLIDKALDNLGVLAAGQTPSAEDVAKVDALIDPMVAMLAADEIAYVDAPGEPVAIGGEIDPAQFLALAAVLADEAKCGWGLQADPSFYVLRTQAEERLRRLGRPPRTRRTLRTDPMLRRGLVRCRHGC